MARLIPKLSEIIVTTLGAGTGRFLLRDPHGAAFVGFADASTPIDLGIAKITKLQSPFAAIQLVPADPAKTLAGADRLLLSAVARTSNTGMKWDAKRTSISFHWGNPPAKIEVVRGEIELASDKAIQVWALGPDGKRSKQVPATFANGKATFEIGAEPTVWYEITR